jgi:heterodisulfide reductase subunit A
VTRLNKRVAIVGAGVAGMAAAQTLHQYGLQVDLIERTDQLGGHAMGWACMATDQCNNCGACLSVEMADQIIRQPAIKVHLQTELSAIGRTDQGYRVTMSDAARREWLTDGIIFATGMTPFNPGELESLQYGRHPRIITTAELNHMLKADTLQKLLAPYANPSIAFIQCVGSRNGRLGCDYCSQVCCKVALRQADKLLQVKPQTELTICHIDLQLIGKQLRTQAAALVDRIELLQGVPGQVRIDTEADRLITVHEEPASGKRLARCFDLIVLAVGMRPSDGIQKLAGALGVPFDAWGFVSGDAQMPPGIQVAGAAKFPTDIVSAVQQGINSAHRLAEQIGQLPEPSKNKPVAVFGNGWEGHRVARAVQAAGHPVILLNAASDSNADSGSKVYEHISEAHIVALSKRADLFQIQVQAGGQEVNRQAAALVIANGVSHKAIDDTAPVMSQSALERILVADWEQIPQRIAFWLDHYGPEYKTNCRRALEAAVDLTASGRRVAVILEKILVHGPDGQRLYDRARRQGVRFLRAVNASAVDITQCDDGLRIDLKEASLAGMDLSLTCDLVVASDQVLPGSQTRQICKLINEPLDAEGFSQWANIRYRPIKTRKQGIFFVGSCHEENDAGDLDDEIQTLLSELARIRGEKTAFGDAAEIDAGRCRRCLNCVRTCTHGAVEIAFSFQPQIRSALCIGCGRCVSQCPAQAIDMADIASRTQLKSETVLFACRRSGHLAAQHALASGLIAQDDKLAIIPVSCCNSRIGTADLIEPLLLGAQRVVVAACHDGNCGSLERGGQAVKRLQDMAAAIGIKPEAVRWTYVAANEPKKIEMVSKPKGRE